MNDNPRPLGITLLALWDTFGGIAGLVMIVGLLPKMDATGKAVLASLGMHPAVFAVLAILMMLAGAVGGVGMWFGKAWGWWITTGYFVHGAMRAANAAVEVWMLADAHPDVADDLDRHLTKFAGRIIINSLITLYLFRRDTLDYFDMYNLPRWKALGKIVSVLFAFVGCLWVVSAVLL